VLIVVDLVYQFHSHRFNSEVLFFNQKIKIKK